MFGSGNAGGVDGLGLAGVDVVGVGRRVGHSQECVYEEKPVELEKRAGIIGLGAVFMNKSILNSGHVCIAVDDNVSCVPCVTHTPFVSSAIVLAITILSIQSMRLNTPSLVAFRLCGIPGILDTCYIPLISLSHLALFFFSGYQSTF